MIYLSLGYRNMTPDMNDPNWKRTSLINMIQQAISDTDSSGDNGSDYLLTDAKTYLSNMGVAEDDMTNDMYWAELTKQLPNDMSDEDIIKYYLNEFYGPTVQNYYREFTTDLTKNEHNEVIALAFAGYAS